MFMQLSDFSESRICKILDNEDLVRKVPWIQLLDSYKDIRVLEARRTELENTTWIIFTKGSHPGDTVTANVELLWSENTR